jgi:hypothetical protein
MLKTTPVATYVIWASCNVEKIAVLTNGKCFEVN